MELTYHYEPRPIIHNKSIMDIHRLMATYWLMSVNVQLQSRLSVKNINTVVRDSRYGMIFPRLDYVLWRLDCMMDILNK